jgi:hypothetical protein
VRSLGRRDDGRVGREREVDAGERDQVLYCQAPQSQRDRSSDQDMSTHGLELVQVDVQTSGETERRGDARHNLGDDAVQVLEAGRLDTELGSADVVDGWKERRSEVVSVMGSIALSTRGVA